MSRPSTNYKAQRRSRTPDLTPSVEHEPPISEGTFSYPAHWVKGQLLNVRNNGSTFIVTVLEEEFDPEHPERAKFFDNSFDCQAFISTWYAREPGGRPW